MKNNTKTSLKNILAVILMLACILQGAAVFTAFSYAEESSGSEIDDDIRDPKASSVNDGSAELKFSDESEIGFIKVIRYPFLDTANVAYDWSFPYSDRFFDIPSSEFSMTTAQGSLGLACSAFRSTTGVVDPQYETYLTGAGFYNLYPFGYDQETTEDSLSGIIGMKEIGDTTVIAAVTCGQGYQNEWAGNMKVGTGVRHEGFSTGADLLEGHLGQYIKDNNIEGKKKLWITGMSRAAAIANITAADAIESGEYEDVYAYLFGVPRTTKEPVRYKGIYNICGQYDPVASIPLQSWGYERYGTDLYTPAQESDDDFPVFAKLASKIGEKIDGKGFRNNPEVNYQLRLIVEFMDEFFDGSDEYAERFQSLMVNAVKNHKPDEIIEILMDAFKNLTPEDRQEKSCITTCVNYLSYMAAQHLRANQRQVEAGSWDPDESLAANLMLEHRPSTYVKWMFANTDSAYLLTCPVNSRRLSVIGKVDVTVYGNDVAISAITSSGKVYAPDPDVPESLSGEHGVFMMRNGEETTISLPADYAYTVEISSDKDTQLSYLEVGVNPEKLMPENVRIKMGKLKNGAIRMTAEPGKDLSDPEVVKGDYDEWGVAKYAYLPTVIMSHELDATKNSYLSISSGLRVVNTVAVMLQILLIACIIIDIVHRKKVKKGHPPYSEWYVIVPHLICIITFAVLTQMFSCYMFVISQARAQCAAVTVLFIALLAIRGALHSRKPAAFFIAAALLVLIHLTGTYYNRLPIDSFSIPSMIAFFIMVALLTAAAIWTFNCDTERFRRHINNA